MITFKDLIEQLNENKKQKLANHQEIAKQIKSEMEKKSRKIAYLDAKVNRISTNIIITTEVPLNKTEAVTRSHEIEIKRNKFISIDTHEPYSYETGYKGKKNISIPVSDIEVISKEILKMATIKK